MLFRIAKHKYVDTGVVQTHQRAFETLLDEHIFVLDSPDSWQEFRDQLLWTPEANALLRANWHHLRRIYNSYVFSDPDGQVPLQRGKKHMSMQDAIGFITKESALKFTEEEAVYCYGMCKMTVAEEIPADENQQVLHKWEGATAISSKAYFELKPIEFLELLGRMADTYRLRA